MRIELRRWNPNTEVMLIDDEIAVGHVVDSFYTLDKVELPCGTDAQEQFRLLEDKLSPPKIGGQFAQFNPYWEERKKARERRNGTVHS